MNKIIILGNDHTNTLGLVQTLGRTGYYMIASVWGIKTDLVMSSVYCKELYTGNTPQECIEKIINSSIATDGDPIPIIASCDDAALILEKNKERLKENYVFEHLTSAYTILKLAEKELQVKLASDAKFNIPKSWSMNLPGDIPDGITFPCIIKPLISCQGTKSDIHVCKDMVELQKNLSSLKVTTKVMIQQYIERDYEISILGCGLKNGDAVIPCVENKLTLYPKYTGLECLAKMEPLEDTEIIASIKSLIKTIGYVGPFSVEMMHCKMDNKFYFTEINLRNDGANSFVYKYGVNIPLIHVKDIMNEEFSLDFTTSPGYYIWDYHHFMSLLHRDISIKEWYRELKKSKGFLTYFPDDKKPFYKQYTNFVLRKLHIKKTKRY